MKNYEMRIEGYHRTYEWVKVSRHYSIEAAVRDFAEDHYYEDPCDPDRFEITVVIREFNSPTTERKFKVTAETRVDFDEEEIK